MLTDDPIEKQSEKHSSAKVAEANWQSLRRIFTVPEKPGSTLRCIEDQISKNLVGFLQDHIVAKEKGLPELEKAFQAFEVPDCPIFVSEQAGFLLEQVVANSVHTASPRFVGHMTSALPYFMVSLSKIMMALNQNLVKIETSKVFTPLERQVLAMMHHLVFQQDAAFYQQYMHHSDACLGMFCSGGTVANHTALWVARNQAFPAEGDFSGVAQSGLYRALKHFKYEGVAILVSERGHYSLSKAADLLGIGRDDFYAVPVDECHKIDLDALRAEVARLQASNIKILAIVGVAGSSETGSVDPLEELAVVAKQCGAHFHVDAAWGGAALFSEQGRQLLKGIELADSVTIDAHKQMYVPMGAGMVFMKDPHAANVIRHHAQYIVRKGSRDLGRYSMEGSRPGMAMLVQSGLKVMGRAGYAMLIDEGIQKAKDFAQMIQRHPDFELITEPQLNLLTYRYVPHALQSHLDYLKVESKASVRVSVNETLNKVTRRIQKIQRERGQSFVSRTHIKCQYSKEAITVFRVVLANPLTTLNMLSEILEEQTKIARDESIQALLSDCNNKVL